MDQPERLLRNMAGLATRTLALKNRYRIEIMEGDHTFHQAQYTITMAEAIATMISLHLSFKRKTVLKVYGQDFIISDPIVTLENNGFSFPGDASKPMYMLITSQSGYDADLFPTEDARKEVVARILPEQDPAYDDVIEVQFWANGYAHGASVPVQEEGIE